MDHTGILAQDDNRLWPSLQGHSVGRFRNLEILDAGKMLDNVLPRVVPHIDPVGKISSGFHAVSVL